jgi:hypothetical protein
MKVLGIIFDKNGISENNLKIAKEKIIKAVNIWSSVKLSMLERIIVCKTFLLSKLYFFANFIYIDKKYISIINSTLHKFI